MNVKKFEGLTQRLADALSAQARNNAEQRHIENALAEKMRLEVQVKELRDRVLVLTDQMHK